MAAHRPAPPEHAVMSRLVASPACVPQLGLDEALAGYAALGFRQFEAFTSWAASRLDPAADPDHYLARAAAHGMRYTSMHLPPVKAGEAFEQTLQGAIDAAAFAERIGADVVLFKADSRQTYVRAAAPFLDALAHRGIHVVPVLQNHKGTPITSLDDFASVLEGIDDPRMKALLEVGHFHRAGVYWRQAYDMLRGRIALVHINEIRAGQSVPYGSGEVDFTGLLAQLRQDHYPGHIVVELELDTRNTDADRTFAELANALVYLRRCGLEDWA